MVQRSQSDDLGENNGGNGTERTRVSVLRVLLPWIPMLVGGAILLGGLKIAMSSMEGEVGRTGLRVQVIDERQSLNGQRIAALEAQVIALQEQVRRLQQRQP